MPDKLKAAALVLSDLHFGADLYRGAEIPPVQIPWWKNILAPAVRRYMETRCKSHDFLILMYLPLYLKKLIHQMRKEGYDKQDFDLYLVLGDLSTYANGASYSFLRQYLTETTYSTYGFKKISALNIPPKKLVVIPGNHDKMLRKDLDIFGREFAIRLDLGAPQPKRSFFIGLSAGDVEFLFILVDASIYASTEERLDLHARKHLAKGEVSKDLKAEIKYKLNELREGKTVDRAAFQNYSRALKILLVHYAVDDRAVLGVVPQRDELVLPHYCKGLDKLVRELRSDLHLVVHGHLHWPKVYNHEGVRVISATTTTQLGGYNGFFVVKFFESGDVLTEHHKWKTNGFSKDDDPDLNVRISLPLVRTVARAGSSGV